MPKRIKAKFSQVEWYDVDLLRVRFDLGEAYLAVAGGAGGAEVAGPGVSGAGDPSLAAVSTLDFLPGQFMSVGVEGFIRRSYSIANPPRENTYLETFVDCGPGGPGSRYFLGVKEGDVADLLVPLGQFIYESADQPVYFFATGTGIVPLLSMIRHELEVVGSGRPVNLFYGVRNQQRIMVGELLDRLARENANFTYHLFVSRPTVGWQGLTGRFTQAVPEINFTDTEVYICGGGKMIDEVEDMAVAGGANPRSIYYEKYY